MTDEVGRIVDHADGAAVAGLYTYGEIARTRGYRRLSTSRRSSSWPSHEPTTPPPAGRPSSSPSSSARCRSARTRSHAAREGVERAAESVEAECAALIRGDTVVASVGWLRFDVPERQLAAVAAAHAARRRRAGHRPVPGGRLAAGGLATPQLVIARAGTPFTSEETTLLRGMVRGLALAMRLLETIDAERGLRARADLAAAENVRLLETLRKRQRVLEAMARIQRAISRREPLEGVLETIVGRRRRAARRRRPRARARRSRRPGLARRSPPSAATTPSWPTGRWRPPPRRRRRDGARGRRGAADRRRGLPVDARRAGALAAPWPAGRDGRAGPRGRPRHRQPAALVVFGPAASSRAPSRTCCRPSPSTRRWR